MQMIKNYFEKLFVILFTFIVCIIILEFGLRLLDRKPSNITDGVHDQFENSYKLKANMKKTTNWPAFSYVNITNSFGFRDKSTGDRNIRNHPYYVFLGASEVYANGVNYEDSFVGIVDQYASKFGIEVLNMAIGGHRPVDQEALFKHFLSNVPHGPDKVFFCLDALTIPIYNQRHDNILVKDGYVFEKDSWRSAYIRIMLGNISSAYCFFRDNFRKLQVKWVGKTEDKSPDFFKVFSKKNKIFQKETIKKFENYLDRFKNYCLTNNITPIYVYMPLTDSYRLNDLLIQSGKDPEQYDVTFYEKLLKKYCEERNIKFINLSPVLKREYDAGKEIRFDLDAHYNKYANRVIGEFLINEIFKDKN
jgi:hypothetical protein